MVRRPRALQQSQLISDIAKDTGLPIITVRRVLEAYEQIAKTEFMNGKKIPLPAGMGYVYATVTRTTQRTVKIKFSADPVIINPRLRTVTTFSEPWKSFINDHPKAAELIRKLIEEKEIEREDS